MSISRRSLLQSGAFVASVPMLKATGLDVVTSAQAQTQSPEWKHALSLFGDIKYPAGFKHFDYVNPDAPKGGRVSQIGTAGLTTFDSFNAYILKAKPRRVGRAPAGPLPECAAGSQSTARTLNPQPSPARITNCATVRS